MDHDEGAMEQPLVEEHCGKDLSRIACPFPRCHWGAACKYDHGHVRAPVGTVKGQFCGHYMKGKCFYGSDCRFEHPDVDFKQKKKIMALCKHYLMAARNGDKRGCTFGNNCRYLHQDTLPEGMGEEGEEEVEGEGEGEEVREKVSDEAKKVESGEDVKKKKKRRKKKKRKKRAADGYDSTNGSAPPSLVTSESSDYIKQQLEKLEKEWLEHFPDPSPNAYMDSLSDKMYNKIDTIKSIITDR